MRPARIRPTTVEIIDGSITTLVVDAIVNAANSTLGFPAHEAAETAVEEVAEFARHHERELRVVFACFGVAMVKHYQRALWSVAQA